MAGLRVMDEPLATQDFMPAFTSTARPVLTRPVASSAAASADVADVDECDDDLLAAFDLVDAASGKVTLKSESQQKQQNANTNHDDEDWDDDALAEIAELEQSVCMAGDPQPTVQAATRPAAARKAATGDGGNGHTSSSPSVTSLQGENQLLRDRQTTYERRISALQQQLSHREEVEKSRQAQKAKEMQETIEKLTTRLQFKDQDLEELRKENQRLAEKQALVKKQQEQQAQPAARPAVDPDGSARPAPTLQDSDPGFPTVTSFLSQECNAQAAQAAQTAQAGVAKRPHSTVSTDQEEKSGPGPERQAKRRFPQHKPSPLAVPTSFSPAATTSANSTGRPTPPVATHLSRNDLFSLPHGEITHFPAKNSYKALLNCLVCDPIVSDEVMAACQEAGVSTLSLFDILQISSQTPAGPVTATPQSDADPTADDGLAADAVASDQASAVFDSADGSRSGDVCRTYGRSSAAGAHLVQKLLRASARTSTPDCDGSGHFSDVFETSLSAIHAPSAAHQAIGLWLSRLESLIAKFCEDFSASFDAEITPELLPAASQQQQLSHHGHSATANGSRYSQGAASQQPVFESPATQTMQQQQQQHAVEVLCVLDHLLRSSTDACVMIATGVSSSELTDTPSTSTTPGPLGTTSSSDSELGTMSTAAAQVPTLSVHAGEATAATTTTPTHANRVASVTADATLTTPHGVRIQPVAAMNKENSMLTCSGRTYVRSTFSHRLFVNKEQHRSSVEPTNSRGLRLPWMSASASPNTGGGGGGGSDFLHDTLAPVSIFPPGMSPAQPPFLRRTAGAGARAQDSVGTSADASETGATTPQRAAAMSHLVPPHQLYGSRTAEVNRARAATVATLDDIAPPQHAVADSAALWQAGDVSYLDGAAGLLRKRLLDLFARGDHTLLPLRVVAGSALATICESVTSTSRTTQLPSDTFSRFVSVIFQSGSLHVTLPLLTQPSLRVLGLKILLAVCAHPAALQRLCVPRACVLKLLYLSLTDGRCSQCPLLAVSCLLRLLTCHGNRGLAVLIMGSCTCSMDLFRSLVLCLQQAVYKRFHPDKDEVHCQSSSKSDRTSSSKPLPPRLLLLRQCIFVLHTVVIMPSFDHPSAMTKHFRADISLIKSFTALVLQLREFFEQRERDSSKKLLEVTMLTSLWDFLTDCSASTNCSASDDSHSSGAEEAMTS